MVHWAILVGLALTTLPVAYAVAGPVGHTAEQVCGARLEQRKAADRGDAAANKHHAAVQPTDLEIGTKLVTSVCSPGGRAIFIAQLDNPANMSWPPIELTIENARTHQVLYESFENGCDFSPDKRFLVCVPWGGGHGEESVAAMKKLVLVDADSAVRPVHDGTDISAPIYPQGVDDFHGDPNKLGNEGKLHEVAYYNWAEALTPPLTGVSWHGPRHFSFVVGKSNMLNTARIATATVETPAGVAPVVRIAWRNMPPCRFPARWSALYAVPVLLTSFDEMMRACGL